MLSAIIATVLLSQCPGGSCPTYSYRQPVFYRTWQPVQVIQPIPVVPYTIVLVKEPPKIRLY